MANARWIAAGHDSDLTKVEPHIDEGADSVAVTVMQSTRDQANAEERGPGDEREEQRGDDEPGC